MPDVLSGKSFALNFLLVQALQYDPRILILDLGGSYRWLTQFLGGGYLELSPEGNAGGGFRLRPFSLPAGERTFGFLAGWISRLLRIGGWTLGGEDPSEIRAPTPDPWGAGPFASLKDVARSGALARRRGVGSIFR